MKYIETSAKIMPWVISLFIHAGLALILTFVTMLVKIQSVPNDIIVPDPVYTPGNAGIPKMSDFGTTFSTQTPKGIETSVFSHKESTYTGLTGLNKIKDAGIIGFSPIGGTKPTSWGKPNGTGTGDPSKIKFIGTGGNAHHVVFVIDRSGSMIDTFQFVVEEMLITIGRMSNQQDFHVILFSDGNCKEIKHKRLVPVTDYFKKDAADFLEPIKAEGKTDPIQALNRAFDVLAQADPNKKGKLILLLTDGVFPDNKKVIDLIKKRNKDVMINTYLYGNKPPEAVSVLQTIAKENGGMFKYEEGK